MHRNYKLEEATSKFFATYIQNTEVVDAANFLGVSMNDIPTSYLFNKTTFFRTKLILWIDRFLENIRVEAQKIIPTPWVCHFAITTVVLPPNSTLSSKFIVAHHVIESLIEPGISRDI